MRRIPWTAVVAALTVAGFGAFVWGRVAASHGAAAPTGSALDTTFHLLLALATIIVASRLVGALFRRIGQPPVMGEMIAGILLGPSLLGRAAPGVAGFLLPASALPVLGAIAQIGIVLYMFLVGLKFDTTLLRGRKRESVAISHASIVVPFALGAASALWLHPRFAPAGVSFTVSALFLGVAMSVTAFPVLARILADRGLSATPIGATALACAAVDDVSAWCLLAFVVGVARADATSAVWTLVGTAAFVAAMLLIVRPLAQQFVARCETRSPPRQDALAIVCVAVLVCALTTEAIGIHALFGAFLLGAIVPHDSALARDIAARLEDVVVVLFLPAFFAFTGMRTQVGLLDGASEWLVCAAIVVLASVGKFGGTFVAARLTGRSARDAATLGVLMNTRGLMEVVVLNVGMDLGVISPTVFTMLVIMAIVTTIATAPLVHALRARSG